ETGEPSLGREVQPVLSHSIPRATKRGRIVDGFRELVICAQRETAPKTLGSADSQRVKQRVPDGRIIGEPADCRLAAWSRPARRSLIRKRENIEPRPLRAQISYLDENAPTHLALNRQIPGLGIRCSVTPVHRKRVRDIAGRGEEKTFG